MKSFCFTFLSLNQLVAFFSHSLITLYKKVSKGALFAFKDAT